MAGGELFEKLSREEAISEKEVVFFIKQILQGVRCMHRKGILHLDLKVGPISNSMFVLFLPYFIVALIDSIFSLSCPFSSPSDYFLFECI